MVDPRTFPELLYVVRQIRREITDSHSLNLLGARLQNAVSGEQWNADGNHTAGRDNRPGRDYSAQSAPEDTLSDLILQVCNDLLERDKYKPILVLLTAIESSFCSCRTHDEVKLLVHFVRALLAQGSSDRLRDILTRTVPMVEQMNLPKELLLLYGFSGSTYDFVSNLEDGHAEFLKAFAVAETIDSPNSVANLKNTFANFLLKIGRREDAIAMNHEALSTFERIGKEKGVFLCLVGLSHTYHSVDFGIALEFGLRALESAEKIGKAEFIVFSLQTLANLYYNYGYSNDAINLYRRAMSVLPEVHIISYKAHVLSGLGAVELDLGDVGEAYLHIIEALDLYALQGYRSGEINALLKLGAIASELEMPSWALSLFKQARESAIRSGLLLHKAMSFMEMAKCRATFMPLGECLTTLAETRLDLENIKNELLLTECHEVEGDIWRANGFLENALRCYHIAHQSYIELGASNIALDLGSKIAEVYSDPEYRGHSLDKALPFVRDIQDALDSRVLDMSKTPFALFQKIAEQSESWQEAFTYCQRRLDLAHDSDYRETRTNLQRSIVLTEKNKREAELAQKELAQRALIATLLPAPISDELLSGREYVANSYAEVSLLLLDIIGFTEFAAQSDIADLVDFLNRFFSGIDAICRDTGVEKIKTIGDAYLGCCGAPYPDQAHAKKVMSCATAILAFVDGLNHNAAFTTLFTNFPDGLQVRIGLHSGSVIGGVVGLDRYQFELWGEAIDKVKEIESLAKPNSILCSPEFEKAMRFAE